VSSKPEHFSIGIGALLEECREIRSLYLSFFRVLKRCGHSLESLPEDAAFFNIDLAMLPITSKA
jgi:hypothetical protein